MIKKRVWTQQPQNAVQAIPSALAVCIPILSNVGYGAVKRRPLKLHYGSGNTISPTKNGYIFTQTTDEDVHEAYNAVYPTRNTITYFSYFSIFGIVADNSFLVAADVSNEGSLFTMADGSLRWVGDAGQVVSSSAGIINVGSHFAEVHLTSPTNSSVRNTSIYLDGNIVASSTTATYYSNGARVGPRGYSNQNNSTTTLGIHLCGALNTRIPDLWKNPWAVIQPLDNYIYLHSGDASTNTYTIYPTGSLTFVSTTPTIKTNVLPTSGKVTYSGTNSIIFSNGATTYTITPSGSISYINSSILKRDRVLYTSGNITYSGIVVTQHIRLLSVSGLITYTGSVNNIKIKIVNPTGKISYTGTNPIYVPGSGTVTTRLPLTGAGN